MLLLTEWKYPLLLTSRLTRSIITTRKLWIQESNKNQQKYSLRINRLYEIYYIMYFIIWNCGIFSFNGYFQFSKWLVLHYTSTSSEYSKWPVFSVSSILLSKILTQVLYHLTLFRVVVQFQSHHWSEITKKKLVTRNLRL